MKSWGYIFGGSHGGGGYGDGGWLMYVVMEELIVIINEIVMIMEEEIVIEDAVVDRKETTINMKDVKNITDLVVVVVKVATVMKGEMM